MTTTLFICGLWFLSFVSTVVRPTSVTVLAAFPLTLALLGILVVNFVQIFTKWKLLRYRALIRFGTCIIVVVAGWEVRGPLNDALFWHWRLPGYEATIQKIESGAISVSGEMRKLSPNEYDARLAEDVWAERDGRRVLIVEFIYGGTGALGILYGYLYCESGQLEPGSPVDERWRWKTRLNDKWFEVED